MDIICMIFYGYDFIFDMCLFYEVLRSIVVWSVVLRSIVVWCFKK
ncbi:hypothetical protein M153_3400042318 [Pseudoloma neurophilia]|uniref:Uncharacterized protein n=1 Tax=Pseudoloma neurophilia TaxID=146866 RepID=A0A0R0M7J4_9MICR|nr:hypothetical protein M153_3400042318 [Pseudoloma neurophilia]